MHSCYQLDPDALLHSGATGGVGKRVVQALLRKGKAVRALVRDENKASKLLVGPTFEKHAQYKDTLAMHRPSSP